jgi:hypothetical protein
VLRPWIDGLSRPPADADDAARAERTCRDLGARVRDRIWSPIAHAAGDAREILIVPEGPVVDLPWHALPASGKSYLAESPVRVRVLWSERDLVPPLAAPQKASGLLAVGDPAFDRAPDFDSTAALALAPAARPPSPCFSSRRMGPAPHCPPRAPRLGVADVLWSEGGASLLLGAEADEPRFKREAPGKAVLHIATHGVMVQDTCRAAVTLDTRGVGGVGAIPAQTKPTKGKASPAAAPPTRPTLEQPWLERQVWLALVGANRPFDSSVDENEGLLTAEEVVTLDLRGTDWVVLSACHSGYAQTWAREGAACGAFHLAGAGWHREPMGGGRRIHARWMTELYARQSRRARRHRDGERRAPRSPGGGGNARRTVLPAVKLIGGDGSPQTTAAASRPSGDVDAHEVDPRGDLRSSLGVPNLRVPSGVPSSTGRATRRPRTSYTLIRTWPPAASRTRCGQDRSRVRSTAERESIGARSGGTSTVDCVGRMHAMCGTRCADGSNQPPA